MSQQTTVFAETVQKVKIYCPTLRELSYEGKEYLKSELENSFSAEEIAISYSGNNINFNITRAPFTEAEILSTFQYNLECAEQHAERKLAEATQ